MWRSSQCKTGILNNRKMEDELMLNEIGKTANNKDTMINNSRVVIFDARPWLSAQGNRAKGGGFEISKHYRNTELVFCDVDNIHHLSKCTKKICEIAQNPSTFFSSAAYSAQLEASDYK